MTHLFTAHQHELEKLYNQAGIKYLALFGSHARGEATPNSDIDLLVDFVKPVSLLDIIRVERQLSQILHQKVDLLTEGDISPYIKPYIQKDLKTIYATTQ